MTPAMSCWGRAGPEAGAQHGRQVQRGQRGGGRSYRRRAGGPDGGGAGRPGRRPAGAGTARGGPTWAPVQRLGGFAHTPAAPRAALGAARELASGSQPPGRVLVVFGAGGERDRGKRPLMGEVASGLADVVFLTTDNPRSEDPMAIIGQVASGAREGQVVVQPDRAEAIAEAIGAARPGDVVLIAGKGHETTQEIGGQVRPFDDAVVARQAVRQLWGPPAGGGGQGC